MNQASEAINPLSSRYSNPPFEPSLNIGHPLTSGYARNEEESNTKKLLTDIDYEDVPNPEAYKILHLSSKPTPSKLRLTFDRCLNMSIIHTLSPSVCFEAFLFVL